MPPIKPKKNRGKGFTACCDYSSSDSDSYDSDESCSCTDSDCEPRRRRKGKSRKKTQSKKIKTKSKSTAKGGKSKRRNGRKSGSTRLTQRRRQSISGELFRCSPDKRPSDWLSDASCEETRAACNDDVSSASSCDCSDCWSDSDSDSSFESCSLASGCPPRRSGKSSCK